MIRKHLTRAGLSPRDEEFEGEPHLFVPSKRGLKRHQRRKLREAGFSYAYYPTNEGYLPGWALKITKEED
jgi:hypothetical protein